MPLQNSSSAEAIVATASKAPHNNNLNAAALAPTTYTDHDDVVAHELSVNSVDKAIFKKLVH